MEEKERVLAAALGHPHVVQLAYVIGPFMVVRHIHNHSQRLEAPREATGTGARVDARVSAGYLQHSFAFIDRFDGLTLAAMCVYISEKASYPMRH